MLTLTVLITLFVAAMAVSVGVRILGVALRACGWLLGVGLSFMGILLLPFGIIIALVVGAAALLRLLVPIGIVVLIIAMLNPGTA